MISIPLLCSIKGMEVDPFFQLNVSDIRYVAFDTETTGLSSSDEIVELAAVGFDEEFEHRAFSRLCKPSRPIPENVIQIHGITNEMVLSEPDSDTVLDSFFEFLNWVGKPSILIAHNAGFDLGMLKSSCRKKLSWTEEYIVLDSCALSRNLLPDLKSHSLDSLCRHFKIESNKDRHRAFEDVRLLKEVFLRLLGIAADQSSNLTVERLIDFSLGYSILKGSELNQKKAEVRLAPKMELLKTYCEKPVRVRILYSEDQSERYISPIEVKQKGMRLYLKAYCHRDGIEKTFRADRIQSIGSIQEEENFI